MNVCLQKEKRVRLHVTEGSESERQRLRQRQPVCFMFMWVHMCIMDFSRITEWVKSSYEYGAAAAAAQQRYTVSHQSQFTGWWGHISGWLPQHEEISHRNQLFQLYLDKLTGMLFKIITRNKTILLLLTPLKNICDITTTLRLPLTLFRGVTQVGLQQKRCSCINPNLQRCEFSIYKLWIFLEWLDFK